MLHRINFLRKIEGNFRSLAKSKTRKNDFKKIISRQEGLGSDIEKDILKKICIGRGADIGCGSNKVEENCIGVDLFGEGEIGKFGSQKGKISQANIKSQGDKLPFKNNELDFLVAKHNLEHYENPEKTLREWKRVLRKGGKIGVIVPDDKSVNTKKLDITHYSEFDLDSLEELFRTVGFKILGKGEAIKHWSIYLIGEK